MKWRLWITPDRVDRKVCQLVPFPILCVVNYIRSGRSGSLEIDGFSFVEGESGGSLQMLNTEGNIFLGEYTKTVG